MEYGKNKPITYFIGEPRDKPCCQVNPTLWHEFKVRNPQLSNDDEFYTEAYCVQWLDFYHEEFGYERNKSTNKI